MFITEPFLFQTDKSHYFYDDSTGIVLPINEDERKFLSNITRGTSLEDYNYSTCSQNLIDKIKRYHLFSFIPPKHETHYDETVIENIINKHGIGHLCLVMTDECNFRCKYCIYSEHYTYSKRYRRKEMSFDIAMKAIDYYFSINAVSVKTNPHLKPSIGFYGGEPLLNWDTIVQIVEYVKTKYTHDCIFAITTNGLLLSADKIEYMLNNNFAISVSLDGDKDNHDRNRVDIASNGTFDRVFSNLCLLESAVQERKRSGFDKNLIYYILVTYDNISNLEQINTFFSKHPNLCQHIISTNKVNASNTDYYENQSSEKILEGRKAQLQRLLNLYKEELAAGQENFFLKRLFGGFVSTCSSITCYGDLSALHGACIPGAHKLTVDVDGRFHICEKISPQFSIGNIENGFDYSKIALYVNQLIAIRQLHCQNCNIKNRCSLCYVQMESDNCFSFDHALCDKVKNSIASSFSLRYSMLEMGYQI